MEVYRNSIGTTVTLPLPAEVSLSAATTNIDVYLVNGDEVLHEFSSVIGSVAGEISVVLPWIFLRKDADLTVEWVIKFTLNEEQLEIFEKTPVQVVTPYVSITQARALNSTLEGMTEEEIIRLERRVRMVIDAYTGQNFGKKRQTISLPMSELNKRIDRLLEVESIVIGQKTYPYEEYSHLFGSENYNIKSDSFEGVIWAPPLANRTDNYIDVIGVWGWEEVPTAVRSAAMILIDEYSCDESVYRDRYIGSVKASDWRFDYVSGAFEGTGNVQADQLLQQFREESWAVI